MSFCSSVYKCKRCICGIQLTEPSGMGGGRSSVCVSHRTFCITEVEELDCVIVWCFVIEMNHQKTMPLFFDLSIRYLWLFVVILRDFSI